MGDHGSAGLFASAPVLVRSALCAVSSWTSLVTPCRLNHCQPDTLLVTSSSPFKDAVSKYSHVLGYGSEGVSVAGVLGRKAQLALFSGPSLSFPPSPLNQNKKVTVNAN